MGFETENDLQINLEKQYGGRHLWTMGYFAIPFGTITDEMINDDIHNEQEGERVAADRELPALQARVIQYVRRPGVAAVSFLDVKVASMNQSEAQNPGDDQKDCHNVIEQLRHNQDQDACDQRDDRLKVCYSYGHSLFLMMDAPALPRG